MYRAQEAIEMAVVINEFEVVAEPPPANQPAETGAGAKPSGTSTSEAAPTPQSIERIVRRQIERFARVRAH
jgi:hypothetical protein